jgi:hypothetical protein
VTKKTAEELNIEEVSTGSNGDLGTAVYGLAKEIAAAVDSIAEELRPLYRVAEIADNLGELASALHGLANARGMSVIAQYGNDEDRAKAVAYLKRWFHEDFRDE